MCWVFDGVLNFDRRIVLIFVKVDEMEGFYFWVVVVGVMWVLMVVSVMFVLI